MRKQNTHPGICAAVISHLKAWQTSSPGPKTHSQAYYNLSTVVLNQNEIGWQAFIEGCPSHGWQSSQQQYYEFLCSRITGLRWLSALIHKLWQVAWDMWEHRNGVLHDKEQGQAALERAAWIIEEFEEGTGHWIVTPDYCLGQVCKRCYGTRQDHNWCGLLELRWRGNEWQYNKERWILEDDRDQ
jgi:hypothetical protein